MILSGATDKLQIVTGQASAVKCSISWIEANNAVPPVIQDLNRTPTTSITTAATTDLLTTTTAAMRRRVVEASFFNDHASISNAITIQHTDGTIVTPKWKGTLLAGEKVDYEAGRGFKHYDVNGDEKLATQAVDPSTNDFRLSGVTATPVMTADSTSLSTIFLAQYKGNRIALRDSAGLWQLLTPSSEVSLAVTGRTTDLPFDIFAFISAGVVTLEFLNWTNATTRATAIARQDGVWTKSGDATRRWLGSCRARSATTFHFVMDGVDLPCKFDLFNADNRVEFSFRLRATTNTWTYTTATWRQAQASANYQVDIMVGIQEENFRADLICSSRNSTISIPRQVGIGFDTTTAYSGLTSATANEVASIEADQNANVANQPGIGRHFYSWNEISTATGTCTWIGDDGALRLQSGMNGAWNC